MIDLDCHILKLLVGMVRMFGYGNMEYVKDVEALERHYSVM